LQTLSYIHSMGIVHRDIKPENIMMLDDNSFQFKIIDFGLACDAGYGLSQKCGSPGCVAPEILRGEVYGSKVDLFSAGILMYIILTGKSPF
ncbi:serine/threonine protein kinase, partial [Klebsiella pneumoniae]|nr:serine/threonine protein kinase [Klebsiella pneumoniae]